MEMCPLRKGRRLCQDEAVRSPVRETIITPNDFMVPLPVVEGKGVREGIASMPGCYRYGLDLLAVEVKELWNLGLKAVFLFVKIPDDLKDDRGTEASNPGGLMQRAIQAVKNAVPEMSVMTDVTLDPYSVYGHDGIVEKGQMINDPAIEALCGVALSHAEASTDFVTPSGIVNRRIKAIRRTLEGNNFQNVGIMSYSAKYASTFHGPFRNALDSTPVDQNDIPKDKKAYQMDYRSCLGTLRETYMDIEERADIVIVEPKLCYLDIVCEVKNMSEVPVAVHQMSGKYAVLKATAAGGWLDRDAVMLGQIVSIKRIGADITASYFTKEVVEIINR